MPVTPEQITDCIRRQMMEIDRLRTINARQAMEIEHLVAWASSDLDALMILQAIYRNPNTPEGNRLKAAATALGFERSKPPSMVAVAPVKLFDILEARRAQGKVIEQAPEPKLDLAEGETVLGGPDSAA
jgi:hypothetical protein